MQFLITDSNKNDINTELSAVNIGLDRSPIKLFGTTPLLSWVTNLGSFVVYGSVIGLRKSDKTIETKPSPEDLKSAMQSPSNLSSVEGRFALFHFLPNGSLEVWTDQLGRIDIYYQQVENEIYIASGLDLLPVSNGINADIDSVAMMQANYIYGGRPVKKHTWYKQVRRIGVSEILRWDSASGVNMVDIARPAAPSMIYSEPESLNDYSATFIESIRARASADGNVVFLSSGWDSTSILATLVHLFGKSKTRAVIGRMKYSERSGVCNTFEMDRAKKIADYFGVRLDVVDLDYRTGARELANKLSGTYKAQQFTNITGFNHWILSEYAASTSNGNETVFAGEMSDGIHNFGFSQYASMFHPNSYDFREYSDKMATYLFGPTFLNVLLSGEQDKDPVWNLFKSTKSSDFFEQLAPSEALIKKQFLSSFFLRSGRMPLAKNDSKLLSMAGKKELDAETISTYLQGPADNLTPDNLYATYINLYDSFHWQGSTVATLYHALDAHNMGCALPFHDSQLVDFLSHMPEHWGRGLELKPTKYPLKWMLSNKIDYPMELQTGAHSYTYDVDPNFTHYGELLNHSSLTGVLKETLSEKRYESFLSPDHFDHDYINGLVSRFRKGEEIIGAEQYDLFNIGMHSLLGPVN